MAQKVRVELIDDLDGTASDDISTVTFGLDGALYEIDLNDDNAQRLRDSLANYVSAARRTGGRVKRAGSAAPSATDREQTKAVRDWARKNGYELADRGRIPTEVLTAFEEAHAAPPVTRKSRSRKK